ncbi:MAG: branched-chain amino acid ABC transporter permease [Desulfarculaceae bacterium]|nr:branched-chain amino acid ABC transporter permease [Desulfarculaceae bacterium]MCF8073889.1 branched-chain amino acid ABC transporter permease [Desulfarculaceae bacterium]MCF8102869.1 branched-chain amino acid ABC transporter permease [Desulfarculaceae bacterium]MCF8116313.1 branched-chain amino acid ABC transporter permease [Desulfarculaceae bacterium]
MDAAQLTQQMINGLTLGSLYALIAIGYTMVYGILRLINFAHGDVLMVGCYFAWFGAVQFGLPWWVALMGSMALTAALGVLIDQGAYRPLRQAPRISALITAIGVSFFLENLGLVVFGGRPKAFARPEMFNHIYQWGEVRVLSLSIWVPILTAIILAGLILFIHRTRMGMAMRALSRDLVTVQLMGIDPNRIIAATFALGSALAAAGGVLWAMKYPQINPLMGVLPGLKAFVAAVLGGIGNVTGAMLGGLLLGMAEIMLVALLPELAGYRDALAFVMLIGILIFRPTGIMGEELPE